MINWEGFKNNGWGQKEKGFIRILSIDGGGIKGIFPAAYLAKIEESINGPIYDYFDMICGTSTGGIIALALSLGIPAKNIQQLYVNHGKEIFTPSFIGGYVLKAKYNNDKLQKLLKNTFGENRIKDSKTLLCIPSVEHHKAMPKVYKTPHNNKYHLDGDVYMWQVALATSAAPIYFPAACFNNECKLDGGLWANNPIMIGIMEAKYNGFGADQLKILSIGTGSSMYNANNKIAVNGGLLAYNKNLIELIMNLQSESACNMASYMGCNTLERINFTTKGKMDLDSVKESSISELLYEAENNFASTYKNGKEIKIKFFSL